ncbi:hypothetical protein BDW75DRAFT_91881 [Aspergillus navahoensis]
MKCLQKVGYAPWWCTHVGWSANRWRRAKLGTETGGHDVQSTLLRTPENSEQGPSGNLIQLSDHQSDKAGYGAWKERLATQRWAVALVWAPAHPTPTDHTPAFTSWNAATKPVSPMSFKGPITRLPAARLKISSGSGAAIDTRVSMSLRRRLSLLGWKFYLLGPYCQPEIRWAHDSIWSHLQSRGSGATRLSCPFPHRT